MHFLDWLKAVGRLAIISALALVVELNAEASLGTADTLGFVNVILVLGLGRGHSVCWAWHTLALAVTWGILRPRLEKSRNQNSLNAMLVTEDKIIDRKKNRLVVGQFEVN